MTTTFNGLVLDELGTVGNPTVQYANFTTELTSPKGYDGAVLSNFKRDYTTINFDLTLDGTESECIDKLNALVAALRNGQGELVMPGQAERGTHFNAVPNMAITHSLKGFDGMTVPMSFVVPEGCARGQVHEVDITGTDYYSRQDFAVNGPIGAPYSAIVAGAPYRTGIDLQFYFSVITSTYSQPVSSIDVGLAIETEERFAYIDSVVVNANSDTSSATVERVEWSDGAEHEFTVKSLIARTASPVLATGDHEAYIIRNDPGDDFASAVLKFEEGTVW